MVLLVLCFKLMYCTKCKSLMNRIYGMKDVILIDLHLIPGRLMSYVVIMIMVR